MESQLDGVIKAIKGLITAALKYESFLYSSCSTVIYLKDVATVDGFVSK